MYPIGQTVNDGLTSGMRFALKSSVDQPLFDLLDERAKVDAHGVVLDRDTFPVCPVSAATSAV